jgi:CMP/dCMP kinase
MYRTVTLLALEQEVSMEDEAALGSLALEMELDFRPDPLGPPRVFLGERDVTDAIRIPAVSRKVSLVAASPTVRHALTRRQRELASKGHMVLEGRDTGTVVCPEATLKVYLTASVAERARRRKEQLEGQGIHLSLETLEGELQLRDSRDSERDVAPLRMAEGALAVDTTRLSIEQVVDHIARAAGRAAARQEARA